MFRVTDNTWLISDTHFGHDNIIKYCNRPQDHNEIMLTRWAELIGPDDDVLHLGDVWYGRDTDPDYWAKQIASLPGRKYLILGNHDKSPRRHYRDAGFVIVSPFVQGGVVFSHYPLTDINLVRPKYFPADIEDILWRTNIHGHIHNNGHSRKKRGDRLYINLSVEVTDYKPVRMGDVV